MLIFGHVGITTGIIKIYEKVTKKKNPKNNKSIDYRLIIVGSMLPDIIDKPLVQIIYGLKNREGHLIAHSFLFSILMIIIGIIVLKIKKNKSVIMLGVFSLIHQLLDKIMLVHNIFYLQNVNMNQFPLSKIIEFTHKITTPIYTRFPYLSGILLYFERPYVFISEVIGLIIIIVYFLYKTYYKVNFNPYKKDI